MNDTSPDTGVRHPPTTAPRAVKARTVVAVFGFAILAVLGTAAIAITFERDRVIEGITINIAERWATAGALGLAAVSGAQVEGGTIGEDAQAAIRASLQAAGEIEFRVFDRSGAIVAATNGVDVGMSMRAELFGRLIQDGKISGATDLVTGGTLANGFAEAAIPVRHDGVITAYFSAKVDRRDASASLYDFTARAIRTFGGILLVAGGVAVYLLFRTLSQQEVGRRALEQLADDLRLAESIAHVGHWRIRGDGQGVAWSAEMYRIFGQDPATFVPTNASITALVLEEDLPRIRESIAAMRDGRVIDSYDMRIRRPDGEIRYLSQTVNARRDADGTLRDTFGVTHDVTALRQATKALATSEELLQRAIQGSGAAVWEWDLKGGGSVSPRFAEMLGFPYDTFTPSFELRGQLIHPDDLPRVRAALDAAVNAGAPYELDYRIRHADGHYLWVTSRGEVQRDADGRPLRMTGTMVDITARKQAEDDLRTSRSILELAMEASNAGYFSLEEQDSTIHWSPRLRQIFGVAADFVIPQAFFNSLVHPDDLAPMLSIIGAAESSGATIDLQLRARHADGTYRWLGVRGMIQRDPDGKIQRRVGFVRDITAEKAAAAELAASREKLERAVEGSGAALWDWDVASNTLTISDRFAIIVGLPVEGFRPSLELLRGLIHPDDLPAIAAATKASVADGMRFDVEYRVRHARGDYVWVHSRARAMRGADGKVERLAGSITDITERRRAQEALQSSSQTLELAVAASNAGFFSRVDNPEKIYWSPRLKEIFGVPSDFVPATDYFNSIVYPDDVGEFARRVNKMSGTGKPLDMELRVRRGDGETIWVHVRWVEQYDQQGQREREIGFVRDITKEKLAADAVTVSEKKFRDLIEGSIQGVVIHHKFRPLFCNMSYAQMLGYERIEDVLALPSLLVHLQTDARAHSESFWKSAISGALDGQVLRRPIVDRDGNRKWFDIIGRQIVWDDVPAWQMTVLDVTEAVAAEEALRDSEERFRALIENSKDIVALRTLKGIATYVSPSSLQVTGYTPDEARHTQVNDYVHPDDLPLVRIQSQKLIDNPDADLPPQRFRLRRKDGTYIWLESELSLVPSPDGDGSKQVLSVSRDITERVEREQELREANERLINQTQELMSLTRQLEVEREKAERANAAKSQFLAMMSHELRTPMTGVLGMSDLLAGSGLRAEQKDLLDTLTRSAHALLDLLNDILDFAKIEAGRVELESIDFSLHQVVGDVCAVIAALASESGNALDTDIPDGIAGIYRGDAKRYRQILTNLVGNANKFTKGGKIKITVKETPLDAGKYLIETLVSDTGIGIAPEVMARLFKPFEQGDVSTSRKFGGTGLGLAISKNLAELMGGQIWVESAPGNGSTFGFTVLVGAGDRARVEAADPASARRAAGGGTVAPPVRPLKVLVAEDNDTTRMLIGAMLTRQGHAVTAVDQGVAAVTEAQYSRFDLVLMDMQMPIMDGPAAVRSIRSDDSLCSRVPIIALTADAIVEHHREYMAAGADAVITKPIDWALLAVEMVRLTSVRGDNGAGLASPNADLPAATETAPPAASTPEILDEAFLESIVGGVAPATMNSLLDRFSANASDYAQKIAAAARSGDMAQARRAAHALKGLSSQFGAVALNRLARSVEENGHSPDVIAGIAAEIAGAVARTQDSMQDWRERRPL
ncbi:MAG: PAS domain-containing protein [Rhodospirillaceae bacterium]|nr:PAS domain-containing protein [Rhodospirillaceae bacterium]